MLLDVRHAVVAHAASDVSRLSGDRAAHHDLASLVGSNMRQGASSKAEYMKRALQQMVLSIDG